MYVVPLPIAGGRGVELDNLDAGRFSRYPQLQPRDGHVFSDLPPNVGDIVARGEKWELWTQDFHPQTQKPGLGTVVGVHRDEGIAHVRWENGNIQTYWIMPAYSKDGSQQLSWGTNQPVGTVDVVVVYPFGGGSNDRVLPPRSSSINPVMSVASLGRLPNTQVDMRPFLSCLSLSNLLSLLSMVLLECKIVCHSMTPVVLTPFLEALLLCIVPLRWENVYIPFCPAPMSELIDAPTPFIIGMSTEDAIHLEVPSDVYIVDLDADRILTRCRNPVTHRVLPVELALALQTRLSDLHGMFGVPRPTITQVTTGISLSTVTQNPREPSVENLPLANTEKEVLNAASKAKKSPKSAKDEVVGAGPISWHVSVPLWVDHFAKSVDGEDGTDIFDDDDDDDSGDDEGTVRRTVSLSRK